jgi:beta-glucosidase
MVPEDYTFDLLDLVAKGEVPMSRIDDAVSRILK